MPRPRKCRRVCSLPTIAGVAPIGGCRLEECLSMSVDEYETIRLIDWEGRTQEECAVQMNIARTTVTGIYMSARKKLADVLVNGRQLVIEGGDFALCEHRTPGCGAGQACPRCKKQKSEEWNNERSM